MQNSLFPDLRTDVVEAATFDPGLRDLAETLPPHLYLGTSSWHYPGWKDLVWGRDYPEATLSRYGLSAYAKHPLFRTVGLDRSFYRPLSAAQFSLYADQVSDDFRFVVKAPSVVTDTVLRDDSGRGLKANPGFLDIDTTLREFIEPAVEGLGQRLGALVFQISPLPAMQPVRISDAIERLHALLRAIPNIRNAAPDSVIAVEVRDRQWLTPSFTQVLRDAGATYCMGLHAKMPRITEQLPILRALWPGPLVCRWNLNPLHGAYGYEGARDVYAPYNRIVDPDLETRSALARVIAGTVSKGQNAFVTLSNKAEGSSPLSIAALAQAIVDCQPEGGLTPRPH